VKLSPRAEDRPCGNKIVGWNILRSLLAPADANLIFDLTHFCVWRGFNPKIALYLQWFWRSLGTGMNLPAEFCFGLAGTKIVLGSYIH
jgi:hypothetical protein